MRYYDIGAPLLAAWALGVLLIVDASNILTFSDEGCRTFAKSIEVKDSTGSGECKKITLGTVSFMIGDLGEGCTATIYGDDPKDPVCSANNFTLAETSVCYNSTWTYFSVDNCVYSGYTSSTSFTTSTTSTASTAPTTSTTSTTTTTTAPESSSNGVNIGAVVGGTVSGIFVVAILAGAAFYFFGFRPKQKMKLAELSAHPDTSASRINNSYGEEAHEPYDPYLKNDPHPKPTSYSFPRVHEQTHVRHELPP
ncbi:hypothetical protein SAMD00023353_1302420 [Rosellinia necatrix]|uniref:Uncharacterized protein n=1 Tax=Rosellinia necatrix TaxID=77044 RepID=A0A1W2TC38_ROSNE|nr:hypothetical protein SAMD00023353_1302420 [Rosellinia necatrix]